MKVRSDFSVDLYKRVKELRIGEELKIDFYANDNNWRVAYDLSYGLLIGLKLQRVGKFKSWCERFSTQGTFYAKRIL